MAIVSAPSCGLFSPVETCDEQTLSVAGPLSVEGTSIDFDAAEVFLEFSNADGDDACIFDASATLTKGGQFSECSLRLSTTPLVDEAGGLRIEELSLSVDGATCPTWSLPDGLYRAERVDGPIGTISFADSVDVLEVDGCYDGAITIELASFTAIGASASDVDRPPVTVEASTITLTGTELAFAEPASCATPG